ncbi:porin [Rhizobium sp. BG4]|uniref:porin n=1 Tax=Rhizobium sp. BG4 TaxID=2613770 RepID=UPI00193D3A46|nr:porin [Rhizobium sp. BG4]QRM42510.1 porin [Rhizobium sp. BG4]
MTIKSLLLGSAAALAVVSGAQAADAIVAAEPEAVEYVRVCDAYGTGYFYIPGTETCLKIEGYVRFDVNFGFGDAFDNDGGEDWNAKTRGQVQFTAKSDTEYGPLTGVIVYQANYTGGGAASTNETVLDTAYIDIAGLRVGRIYNWWDDDFSGEFDVTNSGSTGFNSIRYQYESGDFYAGIAVEELGGNAGNASQFNGIKGGVATSIAAGTVDLQNSSNNVGIDVAVGGTAGAFTYQVIGGYDVDAENGAIRARLTADVGPGTFGIAGIWSSGPSQYYFNGEWAIAAQYAIKATDKFTITPGVQYTANVDPEALTAAGGDGWDGGHEWRAGVTLDYQIVENLSTKLAVTYVNHDSDLTGGDLDGVTGFFRLQRAF